MPVIRRWNRLPAVYQWAAVCGLLVIMLTASIIAIIALLTSQSAGAQAKQAVGCVNNVLGDRNETSQKDAEAHIAYAVADKAYDEALLRFTHSKPGTEDQRIQFAAFTKAAQLKALADQVYVATLVADQRFRATHPLGHC